ncbi:putative cytochrome P450 [Septoria linicola]|nr:putative cytochrome P450 [Septoria linicola]
MPIFVLAGLALLAVLSITLVKRYYTLRHVPGPFLASVTDLWIAVRVWRGEYMIEIVGDLHKQYGDVVRTGPNRISFAKPEAIPEIYGTSQVYPKSRSYSPLTVLANGQEIPTLITLRDEKRVTEIKRHILSGFSQSTWLKQEDQIDATISILLDQLRSRAGEAVSLNTWLSFWSFDTLTTLAFGETRGFLKAGYDLDNMFPSSKARFDHWRNWAVMPTLEALIYKNWFMQKFQKTSNALAGLAMKRIQERKAIDKSATGRDLLGRYLAASQVAPDAIGPRDVIALTISTIHAGSETVAMISSMALLHMLSNIAIFRKLEKEILNADLKDCPVAYADVEKLPFLDAVMREALRFSTNPHINQRTVSPQGATICGVYVPAGTDVSTAEVCTTRNETIFGPRADHFDPERWIDVDEQKRRDMDRTGMGFSHGRRVCIGQHLARIEMKKMLASLINAFEIQPVKVAQGDWEGNTKMTNLQVRVIPRMQ